VGVLETSTSQAPDLDSILTEESKECYRTARALLKKLTIAAAIQSEKSDGVSLTGVIAYVNLRVESFKKAVKIYQEGGN
jgi:hypothetical protein